MVLVWEASCDRGSKYDDVDRRYLGDRHRRGERARFLADGDHPRRQEPGAGERASSARADWRVDRRERSRRGAPEIPGEAAHEPIVVQETGTRGGPGGDEAVPPGEVPTRTDIPAQRAEGGQREMPRQRAGDADRAARSYTARDTPDDEEPGR